MISSIITTTASKVSSSKGRLINQKKQQCRMLLSLLLPVVHTTHGFNLNYKNNNAFNINTRQSTQQQRIQMGWQLPLIIELVSSTTRHQQSVLYVSFNNNNKDNKDNNGKVIRERKKSTTVTGIENNSIFQKSTNNSFSSVIQSSMLSFLLFFIINIIPFTAIDSIHNYAITVTTTSSDTTETTTTMKQQMMQQTKAPSFLSSLIRQFTSSGIANAATIPVSEESTTTTLSSSIAEQITESAASTAVKVNYDNEITNYDKNVALIDEVYTLVDKYYLNKPKIESNWEQTRDNYREIMKNKLHGDDNESVAIKIVADMIQSLDDKYSRVLDSKQYASIQKYDLIGVGVSLMPDPSNKNNIIVGSPPVPGSAADLQQIHQNDIISAINNIPTVGKSAFDIIEQISANPNAPTITMTVIDSSKSTSISRDVIMNRAYMEIKNPIYYKISEVRSDGTIVGYIQIKEFNSLVKGNFITALQELSKQNVNAYVIDLRHNTGGAFQSAIELASIFLSNDQQSSQSTSSTTRNENNDNTNNNPIATYVVDNSNIRTPFKTKSASAVLSSLSSNDNDNVNNNGDKVTTNKNSIYIDKSIPIVLLVDKKTASASEVLASALHDNCRAIIVGSDPSTYGKGLIQAVYGLQHYSTGLVLTVAKYITPAGNPIQGIGIHPDILLSGKNSNSFSLLGTTLSMSTDTSMINFNNIQYRLSSNMCTIPTKLD